MSISTRIYSLKVLGLLASIIPILLCAPASCWPPERENAEDYNSYIQRIKRNPGSINLGDGGLPYCVAFEVPLSGLTNAPVVTEIKVRGTDFDIVSGNSYPVFWGDARIEKHERIPLTTVRSPGGAATVSIDIDSSHKQIVFDFNSAGDDVSFLWILPTAIDTSSKIEVKLDYSTDAVDTYDLNLSAKLLRDGTLIGTSVEPNELISTAVTSLAANTFYVEQSLSPDGISIQNASANDVMSFEIERTDGTNSIYPYSVNIHYVTFSTGQLVN